MTPRDRVTSASGHRDPSGGDDTTDGNPSSVGNYDRSGGAVADPSTVADLRSRRDGLAAENRRPGERDDRAGRPGNRRTAAALAGVGLVALAGGLALPGDRTVLLALGATGLFAAALVTGLAPGRTVAADTAAGLYGARARLGPALVSEFGLADDRVYVPTGAPAGDDPARLFVPERREFAVPALEPGGPVVVSTSDPREAGAALAPTGTALYRELRSWSRREPAPDARRLAEAVVDALGSGFGLVESVRVDVVSGDHASGDPPTGRATFAVAGSVLGPVDRFDHPVASLAGVTLAAGLSVAVAVSVREVDEEVADYLVTCRWPAGEG